MLQEVENKIVRLAERGARVVIASRKIDACEELAAQIRHPAATRSPWNAMSATGRPWTAWSQMSPTIGAGWMARSTTPG
jgi:hypothetical protein